MLRANLRRTSAGAYLNVTTFFKKSARSFVLSSHNLQKVGSGMRFVTSFGALRTLKGKVKRKGKAKGHFLLLIFPT